MVYNTSRRLKLLSVFRLVASKFYAWVKTAKNYTNRNREYLWFETLGAPYFLAGWKYRYSSEAERTLAGRSSRLPDGVGVEMLTDIGRVNFTSSIIFLARFRHFLTACLSRSALHSRQKDARGPPVKVIPHDLQTWDIMCGLWTACPRHVGRKRCLSALQTNLNTEHNDEVWNYPLK